MIPEIAGALLLGLLAGWAAYRNLFRQAEATGLSSIAAVLWANGGAELAGGFGGRQAFGWYAIGLFTAFFASIVIGYIVALHRLSAARRLAVRSARRAPASLNVMHAADIRL